MNDLTMHMKFTFEADMANVGYGESKFSTPDSGYPKNTAYLCVDHITLQPTENNTTAKAGVSKFASKRDFIPEDLKTKGTKETGMPILPSPPYAFGNNNEKSFSFETKHEKGNHSFHNPMTESCPARFNRRSSNYQLVTGNANDDDSIKSTVYAGPSAQADSSISTPFGQNTTKNEGGNTHCNSIEDHVFIDYKSSKGAGQKSLSGNPFASREQVGRSTVPFENIALGSKGLKFSSDEIGIFLP